MGRGYWLLCRQVSLALRRAAQGTLWAPSNSGIRIGLQITQASAATSRLASNYQIQQGIGFAAVAALGAAAAASTEQVALCSNDQLDPGVLKELARDLSSDMNVDKERAVSMLSSLTPYVEHHQTMLEAGVLPCLMRAVQDEKIVPQVRVLALCCAADLMKHFDAHSDAVHAEKFLSVVMSALQSEGAWSEGPEDGLMASSHACRLLSELCSDGRCHPILIQEGAAGLLVKRSAEVAVASNESGGTFTSLSAAPANYIAIHNMEVERYLSAALFGLASSLQGRDVIASAEARIVKGMALWSQSQDPILQRYGIGGIARLVSAGPENVAVANRAGALSALVHGLNSPDAQAQCFASGAVGRVAEMGEEAVEMLLNNGAATGLVTMLTQKQPGHSVGVYRGVQRCALRGLHSCCRHQRLRQAVVSAQGSAALQELLAQQGVSQELHSMAEGILQQLQ